MSVPLSIILLYAVILFGTNLSVFLTLYSDSDDWQANALLF